MVGAAAWSTRAYNKDLQTQRADAQINEYYQIKDAVRTQSVGSQPVTPNAEMNTGIPKLNYSRLPDNAQNSYNEYTKVGWEGNFKGQTEGTAAGKKFRNADNVLPATNQHNTPITYKEFDVNNKLPSQGRDGKRFVRGSDGSVYYTEDHYKTFKKIE